MKVPGTTVTLSELPGAVALEFVTSGDVAELRRSIAEMAEHHQRHLRSPSEAHGPGEAPLAQGAAPGERPHAHRMMVPAQVRVEETANGARLVFTPERATDLDALREHIEKRSKHMEKGDCGMMTADHPPT